MDKEFKHDRNQKGLEQVPTARERLDSRRRKLVIGGVSAPILMTLSARPAWAGNNACTRSALASADLSGRHEFDGCSKSAGFWQEKTGAWPEGVNPSDDFVGTFGVVTYMDGTVCSGFTLGEAIANHKAEPPGKSPNNPGNLMLHLVGAYVNAHAFPNEFEKGFRYTPGQIVDLYQGLNDWTTDGEKRTAASQLKGLLEAANNEFDNATQWPHY